MDARIEELELKFSFQEDLLQELNATVIRQGQQLDLLVRQLKSLYEQIRELEDDGVKTGAGDAPQEVPPHY